jgi:hypothetical protein
MRRSRYTKNQIISFLKEAKAVLAAQLCHEYPALGFLY